jgi:hypothetical protein
MKFKIGDIVEVVNSDTYDYWLTKFYNIGDIGTVTHIRENPVVEFNIKSTGDSGYTHISAYGIPNGWYVQETSIEIVKYTKSPLWRLMNE